MTTKFAIRIVWILAAALAAMGVPSCHASAPPDQSKPALGGKAPNAMGAGTPDLSPVDSGPGVAVGEPIEMSGSGEVSGPGGTVDADTLHFGAACGRWLSLMVGGQGDFGKTPPWHEVPLAMREMHRDNWRLSSGDCPKVASLLGVTHIAVGTISGTGLNLTLTYQWYAANGSPANLGAPATKLAAPISLSGTPQQIVDGLPAMARQLSNAIESKQFRSVATVGLSPEEMRVLGEMPLDPLQAVTTGLRDRFYEVEAHHAAHDWCCLVDVLFAERIGLVTVNSAQRLSLTAPGNVLVATEVARLCLLRYAFIAKAITADSQLWPNNYALAFARQWLGRGDASQPNEIEGAQWEVRDSPASAAAWNDLDNAYADRAESVRSGRFADKIADAEWNQLSPLYAKSVDAAESAVSLDANNSDYWLNLSEAALFAGDNERADAAWWKAQALDPTSGAIYYQGLEMYQPKWTDQPDKLLKVVELMAAAKTPFAEHIGGVLLAMGFAGLRSDRAEKLRWMAFDTTLGASSASDAQAVGTTSAHRYPAIDRARALWKQVVAAPRDAEAWYKLAHCLHDCADQAQGPHNDTNMTPDIERSRTRFQELAYVAAMRAVTFKPENLAYLLEVSRDGAVTWNADVAAAALSEAEKLAPRDYAPAQLGLLIFTPAYGGNTDKLRQEIARVTADDKLSEALAPEIIDAMNSLKPWDAKDKAIVDKAWNTLDQAPISAAMGAGELDSWEVFLWSHGRTSRMLQTLDAQSQRDPADAEPYFSHAWFIQQLNPALAAELYRKALALEPGYDAAKLALANTVVDNRQVPNATDLYRQVVQGHPEWVEVHLNLARSLVDGGHRNDAIDEVSIMARCDITDTVQTHYSYDTGVTLDRALLMPDPSG